MLAVLVYVQANAERIRDLVSSAGSLEALAQQPEKLKEVSHIMHEIDPAQAINATMVSVCVHRLKS